MVAVASVARNENRRLHKINCEHGFVFGIIRIAVHFGQAMEVWSHKHSVYAR